MDVCAGRRTARSVCTHPELSEVTGSVSRPHRTVLFEPHVLFEPYLAQPCLSRTGGYFLLFLSGQRETAGQAKVWVKGCQKYFYLPMEGWLGQERKTEKVL